MQYASLDLLFAGSAHGWVSGGTDMEPKPIPYHELMPDAEMAPLGCAICRLVRLLAESVARYLDDLIFFSAVKPDTELQPECLGCLLAELHELTRKFDHRFKHEVIGAEGDAWLRSIAIVSDKRGFARWSCA
jgi:hypothetical protein